MMKQKTNKNILSIIVKISFVLLIILLFFILKNNASYANGTSKTLNVLDFGAKVDDEIDDTKYIKEALKDCKDGDILYFPKGRYIVSDILKIKNSNFKIIGELNKTEIEIVDNKKDSKSLAVFSISTTRKKNLKNITIKNIKIDGNKITGNRRWTCFGIYRSCKKYKISKISIINCNIENMTGRGITISGYRELSDKSKKNYNKINVADAIYDIVSTKDSAEKIEKYKNYIKKNILNGWEEICSREWYKRYPVYNVLIEKCNISNNFGGIIQNTTYGTKIINNTINKSSIENITIDYSDNCSCINNNLGEYFGGCGNIGTDESNNCIIKGNTIDNTNAKIKNIYNIGICHNSEAGKSINYIIENNNIINAYKGIWLKDARYNEGIKNNTVIIPGSKAGKNFYINNNYIKDYKKCGIEMGELNGKVYIANNKFNKTNDRIKYIDNNVIDVSDYATIPKLSIKAKTSNNDVFDLENWTNIDVTLKIDASTDNKYGIIAYSFDNGISWDFSKNANEKKITSYKDLNIVVRDVAGNIKHKSITVKIDKSKPYLSGKIIKGECKKYVKYVEVEIPYNAIKDKGSGFEQKLFSYDLGKTWTQENKHKYFKDGKKTIYIRDRASNVLKIKVTVKNIDREKPVINSVRGINNVFTNKNICLEVNASDNKGESDLKYSFNNGRTWSKKNKKIFENYNDEIVIKVKDRAGWITTYKNGKKISLKIDKTAPILSFKTRKGIDEWAKNGDYIFFNLMDYESGIYERLWYRVKGTNNWIKNNPKDGAYSHYYIKKEDYGKTLEFMVKDKVGNSTIVCETLKYVDFNAPSFDSVVKDGLDVIISASDDKSGIMEYYDGNMWNKFQAGGKKVKITIHFTSTKEIAAGTIKLKDKARKYFFL